MKKEMCALCDKNPSAEGRKLCDVCLGRDIEAENSVRTCPSCGTHHAGGRVGRFLSDTCQDCLTRLKKETRDAKKIIPEAVKDLLPELLTGVSLDKGIVQGLYLNMDGHAEIMEWLEKKSADQIRTVTQQAIYELQELARASREVEP